MAPPAQDRQWFVAAFDEAPVTVSIVAFTVAVWLAHEILIRWGGINTDLTLADPGTAIHGDWWRLFTPMVVHFGLLHVGLNMFTLWVIGRPVEKVVGRGWYLASYVAAGVGGQVLSDLWYGRTVLSGGASGAIFGVVGVLIGSFVCTAAVVPRVRRVSTQQWRFNPTAVRSLAIQAGIWLILFSVFTGYIDNAAHIGGAVVGLACGFAIGLAHSRRA